MCCFHPATLDYETTTSYTLELTVADGGGSSVIVPITVQVTAVNEGGPVFGSEQTVEITEAAGYGTYVADVPATDVDDGTEHGELAYSISGGNTGTVFTVAASTGRVTVVGSLDKETISMYDLTVKASDGTNTATVTLRVNITDVDDEPPSCTVTSFAVSVDEDEATPYTLSTLSCTDDDTSSLTYTLSVGDSSLFDVTASGVVRLISGLDYDAGTHVYYVTVSVSDGVTTIDVPGTITVNPVNENAPVFTNSGEYSHCIPCVH